MKTLILTNIVSSNNVYRLNSFIKQNRKNLGQTQVFFCAETEANRHWRLREKPKFAYKVLPHLEIKLKGKDLFTYFINPSIIRELGHFDPDQLIIIGWDLFAYQISYFWALFKKRKIILWSESTIYEKSWRRTVSQPLVRFFIHIANKYIASGTRAKEYLLHLGAPIEKISVFSNRVNQVNQDHFRKQSRFWRPQKAALKKKYGLSTRHYLLYVGQFIDRKGIWILLEAYSKLVKSHPSWGLVLIGYGPLRQAFDNYIRINKLNQIKILDFIDQYDLPSLYVCCDILVLPSKEEVWGLVVNEALACGLKVVVSDRCGCAPDLVKPGINGNIFKSGSILSLSNQLQKTIQLIK